MSVQSRFATKSMFAALSVESSGEESDEEISEPELKSNATSSSSEPPAPPSMSKTAQRKAAKAARQQKLQAKKQPNGVPPGTSAPSSESAEIVSETVVETSTELTEPLELEPVDETPVVPDRVPEPPIEATSIAAVDLPQSTPELKSESTPEPAPVEIPETPPSHPPANIDASEQVRKRQNVLTRTLWTVIMIGVFVGLLLMGHAYMILLVMLCQTLVYREVTALFTLAQSDRRDETNDKDPWSKTLNWYFFAVTNYFLYGESIIYYFKHVVFSDSQLLPFATNHRLISFTLYTIGLMGFVLSLQKGFLKQQFGLFCWVHMSLMLVVVSSHFIVNNILEGLIWFWVPASLVICNDIFAYVWGKWLGRTPLIKLSPNKTVEGFVGAFGSTVLFSLAWGWWFMGYNYMICPVHDLGVNAWSNVQCVPNPVFLWKDWNIPSSLAAVLSSALQRPITSISYVPYHFHLLSMSFFASLVAPFGGFFASGFKRAFKIKDFGHSIPGHGGMTDRMDCQFLMGVFTYVYYSSLIRVHNVTVGSILQKIVSGLSVEDQLELIVDLKKYLEGMGVHVPC
ncbi:cytidylyltransferase family-domain-containing protein [Rhodocollybia butyracea]|uniref:Phosphatidate cytidylyltransferase n=1 Tax=Rhodocollybia butyracea TaxID=206335 RepID=A0A9P5Q089_9AGAR|nr:cytidylyltransferase family-domain-containing protein [Rhodocollybia butyracea]